MLAKWIAVPVYTILVQIIYMQVQTGLWRYTPHTVAQLSTYGGVESICARLG